MLEEADARYQILEKTPAPGTQRVSLSDALHLRIPRDLFATVSLPSFDNSQVDGYAVRAADAVAGAELTLAGHQPAGPDLGLRVSPGMAVRIFTGAPIPKGADAIVMQEDTSLSADGHRVHIREATQKGEFIRRRGADLCAGQKILSAGDLVTPGVTGLLASQGFPEVEVYPTVRCTIVTTGDELVSPGSPLQDGEIYNSNGPMLQALVRSWGAATATPSHAPDDPEQLQEVLSHALEDTDLCLIAGGISVGEHDYVKACLETLGVTGGFWKVRIKPGKPLFFGKRDQTLVFGLPGNPVSAYITFLLFALPALRKLQGARVSPDRPPLASWHGELRESLSNDGNRPHYIRGLWDHDSRQVSAAGLQQSHALYSLSRSTCLVRLEAGSTLSAGEQVEVWSMPTAARDG